MVKKRLAGFEKIPQAASMHGFQILAIPLNTIAHPSKHWFASTILAGRRQLSWPVKRGVFNPSCYSVVAAA